MSVDKLHPNVEEFKLFINAHPEIVLKIRKSGDPLQVYYNKWVKYGEDESVWGISGGNTRESKNDYKDLMDQIVKYTEKMDVNKIQEHVKRFNKILDTIQFMIGDFASQNKPKEHARQQTDLFNWFKD